MVQKERTELNVVRIWEVRELGINTAMSKCIVWKLVNSVDFVANIPHVGGFGSCRTRCGCVDHWDAVAFTIKATICNDPKIPFIPKSLQ